MEEYNLQDKMEIPVWKRAFDIVFSIIVILLLAPSFLLIAILIKIESLGPVFYSQKRIGWKGKPFRYYKFRTMYFDAADTAIFPVFKLNMDPRISRVGRILRKTALDELPVFINVLKGDMSIVGPRPPLPLEVEHYTDKEWRRLEIRPGVTGYWQTFGRKEKKFSYKSMIEMDLEYIDKLSFLLDLKILSCSFYMSFHGESAY